MYAKLSGGRRASQFSIPELSIASIYYHIGIKVGWTILDLESRSPAIEDDEGRTGDPSCCGRLDQGLQHSSGCAKLVFWQDDKDAANCGPADATVLA